MEGLPRVSCDFQKQLLHAETPAKIPPRHCAGRVGGWEGGGWGLEDGGEEMGVEGMGVEGMGVGGQCTMASGIHWFCGTEAQGSTHVHWACSQFPK